VENITEALRTTNYGRCVFAMDNDVVDHQVVNIQFESGIVASFTMSGFNNVQSRTIRIAGTEGEIWGNFGMMQEALAIAAVSLDDEAKTDEMLDFVFQSGSHVLGVTTGGNLGPQLINVVDRDGLGNEVGPNYNVEWL
jgi:hypothetical protein